MTHASLFSGIGGPEIAAAMMGWKNIFHCEINTFGRQVLEYWFPNSDSYEDITETNFTRYRGRIDVLTGGFPCQPFSYAGKRGGQKILDTHLGSGSSRIAAYHAGLDFWGCELDKEYFDKMNERFEKENHGIEVVGNHKIQQLSLFE